MKYRLTLLNCATFLYLAVCILYTIWNYKALSFEEGWGVVFMIGLFFVGATALIPDLVVQRLVTKKRNEVVVNALIIILYAIVIYRGAR